MEKSEIEKLPYRPCVGIMLVNAEGHVFVGQRLDNPGPAWQMPQGGIEHGELPQTAAVRELGEETGIAAANVSILAESALWHRYDLPDVLVAKMWKGRFRGQEQKWFLMRLNGADTLINIATETPEFRRWSWMNPNDLVGNIVPFKRDVYVKVLAEFLPILGQSRRGRIS